MRGEGGTTLSEVSAFPPSSLSILHRCLVSSLHGHHITEHCRDIGVSVLSNGLKVLQEVWFHHLVEVLIACIPFQPLNGFVALGASLPNDFHATGITVGRYV